jgi:hypothetical protein
MTHPTTSMMTTTVFGTMALLVSLLLLLLSHNDVGVVNGMPSFGTKIPNGESVPCPTDSIAGEDGCTASGYCLGLGHLNCGGFQNEDAFLNDETNTRIVSLNPFGADFRDAGFVWTKQLCQMDSDNDGYTNGQELGDPCCTWKQGQSNNDITMNSFDGFLPSHPGFPDDTPPLDIAIKCASSDGEDDDDDDEQTTTTNTSNEVDDYYQLNETRGEWDIIIQPYQIPVDVITTYVDFVFNLPDDLPDLVHIVYSKVILSQPQHLHHFVLSGCRTRLDDNLQEGVPVDRPPNDCTVPLGGWAPGALSVFGNDDKNDLRNGVALGRAMGTFSLLRLVLCFVLYCIVLYCIVCLGVKRNETNPHQKGKKNGEQSYDENISSLWSCINIINLQQQQQQQTKQNKTNPLILTLSISFDPFLSYTNVYNRY